MLSVKNRSMVLMSSAGSESGFFYETWTANNSYKKLMVTAADVPRISAKHLEDEKADMTEEVFLHEYFCKFSSAGSNLLFNHDDVLALTSPEVEAISLF